MLSDRSNLRICSAFNYLLNFRYRCKELSDVIRVQCDTGNVHLYLMPPAKFGVSLRINKRNVLRADHFRFSVILSGT